MLLLRSFLPRRLGYFLFFAVKGGFSGVRSLKYAFLCVFCGLCFKDLAAMRVPALNQGWTRGIKTLDKANVVFAYGLTVAENWADN